MSSYFGSVNTDGTLTYTESQAGLAETLGPGTEGTTWKLTCPGSGSQTLDSLETRIIGDGSQNFRIAVYSNDYGTLIASTDSFTPASTGGVLAWVGRTSANITFATGTTLTGGTKYRLVVTNVPTASFSYATETNGLNYNSTDYNSGFPSSITLGNTASFVFGVRAGVTTAGGGGATTQKLAALGVG